MTERPSRPKRKTGRPTKCTPETVALLCECIADGLTDEAAAIADIDDATLTRWRKIPAFCGAVKKATALRLKQRLARVEEGGFGWQGCAWALERLYPTRFSRPEIQNQIAVIGQVGPSGLSALE